MCVCVCVGPASVVCIETLRQEGFTGKIVLCSREDTLPYDRPKLSKVSVFVCVYDMIELRVLLLGTIIRYS